jgi:hypothetical protein
MLGSRRTLIIQRSRSSCRSTSLGFVGDSPPVDDAIAGEPRGRWGDAAVCLMCAAAGR